MTLRVALLILALVFAFAYQEANAYFVAVPTNQAALQYDQTVRIFISGRGTDIGEQPQLSALGRAQLYKRNFPKDQIVLVSVFENANNEARLVNSGWTIVSRNDLKFETDVATKEILKFSKIRSLDFFGHNSPSLGTQLDGLGFRFDFRKANVKSIASHFTPDAFSIIHGCNSGWLIAQNLSKIWNIVVGGSFTGTRFERLHSDGHFYVDEDGRYPNDSWATTNPDLDGAKCSAGGCLRMRPMFSHYNGHWGDLQGPLLSHYKFFCQLDERACEKSMAASLYGYLAEKTLHPSSSYAEFAAVAQQWLCPVYKTRAITDDCYHQLNEIEAGRGNMFISYVVNDQQLSCNLQSCTGIMTCDDYTCKISSRAYKNSDTLAKEYLHLLNGFKALQAEGL